MKRAFTLIELLVTISIIAVLISITLPALAGARNRAKQTVAVSNGRSVGTSFSQYADTYNYYPFADDQHMPNGTQRPPQPGIVFVPWYNGAIIGTSEPWHLSSLWAGLLASTAPWNENYPVWVSPGLETALPKLDPLNMQFDGSLNPHVSWRYSNSFIAKPKVWSRKQPATASDWPALWKGTTPGDVLFPANKVMLWDADLAYVHPEPKLENDHYHAKTPMVFADNHADVENPHDSTEPVTNPFNGSTVRLHNTEDGVRGRDY